MSMQELIEAYRYDLLKLAREAFRASNSILILSEGGEGYCWCRGTCCEPGDRDPVCREMRAVAKSLYDEALRRCPEVDVTTVEQEEER